MQQLAFENRVVSHVMASMHLLQQTHAAIEHHVPLGRVHGRIQHVSLQATQDEGTQNLV